MANTETQNAFALYSGQNVLFQLLDCESALHEIKSFIRDTPNNKYLYSFDEIKQRLQSQTEGVLLIGIAPKSESRPIRGVTIIWDHEQVPY